MCAATCCMASEVLDMTFSSPSRASLISCWGGVRVLGPFMPPCFQPKHDQGLLRAKSFELKGLLQLICIPTDTGKQMFDGGQSFMMRCSQFMSATSGTRAGGQEQYLTQSCKVTQNPEAISEACSGSSSQSADIEGGMPARLAGRVACAAISLAQRIVSSRPQLLLITTARCVAAASSS